MINRELASIQKWPSPVARGATDRDLRPRAAVTETEHAGAESTARVRQLSRLLRLIGAVLVASSAATFVINRWPSENDVLRYFCLLALTALVVATGIACAVRLHEGKGARLLLALGLVVAPMHFCVLGALLYSRLALDSVAASLPSYANWTAPGIPSALLTTAAGLAVLVPLVGLSFRALARPRAAQMTLQFVFAGALLLLPVRHPNSIVPLLVVSLAALVLREHRNYGRDVALQTPEGRFARAAMGLPAAFLVGRSLTFYSATPLFTAGLSFAAAAVLYFVAPREGTASRVGRRMQILAILPAGLGWLLLADLLGGPLARLSPALFRFVELPLFGIGFAATLIAMSLRAIGSPTVYRNVAALVALGSLSLNLEAHPGVGASLLCLGTALCVLAYGQMTGRTLIAAAAGLALALSLLDQIHYAVEVFSLGRWGSLALIGTLAILAGSWVERNQKKLAGVK